LTSRYKSVKNYFLNIAKRLDRYAMRYRYYSNLYSYYSSYYKRVADRYMGYANRYQGYWFSYIYRWVANIYYWYSRRLAYWSRYYLWLSSVYHNSANWYRRYASHYANIEDYYLSKAKKALKEAKTAREMAQNFKQKAIIQERLQRGVNNTYQSIAIDENYNYFYKIVDIDEYGRVTKYVSGNGLINTNDYENSGVLKRTLTGYSVDDIVRDISYKYDILSNVIERVDDKLKVTSIYEYDALNRVISAEINANNKTINLSYRYDSLGNIVYKSDIGYYEYNPNKPHQVIKAGRKSFKYDANGNMIYNDGTTIKYNSFNKPIAIDSKSDNIRFTYDTSNNRYKKETNFSTTYYLGKEYEEIENNDGTKEKKYFINLGDKVISIYSEKVDKENIITPNTKYLHYDALNSVDTITDNHGIVEERFAYKPFGERLILDPNGNITDKTSFTNRGYTGHEHIEGTKLIHMNARVYDSSIGRFLSADSMIPYIYESQSFNRYSYVRNNPLKYTDPTGHFSLGSFFDAVASAVKSVVHTVTQVAETVVNFVKDHAKEIATAAILVASGGLAAGFVATMGLSGYAAAIAGGAVAGFASGVGIAKLNGASWSQAFRAGAKGAVYGAISGAVAYGIGNYFSHNSSFLSPGSKGMANAFAKAVVHGVSRAAMAYARGQKVSSAFWSGFVASGFSVGSKGFGGWESGTAISVVVSGTVSKITGGKFANGAVTGAFVHLFNDMMLENTGAANGFHRRLSVYNKDGKRLYGISFGVKPGESIFGGVGVVYEDYRDSSIKIVGVLHTTEAEDQRIISYMQAQVGKTDTYNVILHNCRDYSSNQFDYIAERILNR
jgi:RHS repeat-associated protein